MVVGNWGGANGGGGVAQVRRFFCEGAQMLGNHFYSGSVDLAEGCDLWEGVGEGDAQGFFEFLAAR